MPRRALLFLLSALLPFGAQAEYARSKKALRAFVNQQACPSTGLHRLPCPGWQIDHIIPLKCLGLDDPENLQWLTIAEHKEKTRREARECRK
jgi:hypothetical protein